MAKTNKTSVIAYDLDDAGKGIGKAVLSNNPDKLKAVSEAIQAGVDIFDAYGKKWKGKQISSGGDQGVWIVPSEALEELENITKEVKKHSTFSVTVGVADDLANAGRSLVYGKMIGKNCIIHYDPKIEKEIAAAQKRDEEGTASAEEHKMNNDYLKKSDTVRLDGENVPKNKLQKPNLKPEYNKAKNFKAGGFHKEQAGTSIGQGESVRAGKMGPAKRAAAGALDHERSIPKPNLTKDEDIVTPPPETECQYCQEIANGDPEAIYQEDHCQYCHDMEQPEEACQYCDEAHRDSQAPNMAVDQNFGDEHPDCPYCQEEENAANTEGVETEENNPEATVEDATSQMEDPQDKGDIVDSAMGIDKEGLETEENVSRPDDYPTDTPSDMGLNEEEAEDQGPDFSEVIRGGLDNHAQNIQKEKVNQLVGSALEGFKNSSHILERAKDQAPELYQSTLMMLKAMIELCKIAGLHPKDEQDPAQEQIPKTDDSAMDEETKKNPAMNAPKKDPKQEQKQGPK